MSELDIPRGPDDVTASWIDDVLVRSGAATAGTVRGIEIEPFAAGKGILGKLARIRIDYEAREARGPESVVTKFPSDSEDNLALCEAIRLYVREHAFYTRSASETPLRVPHLYHAAMSSPRQFVLVMEDITWGEAGNQIEGATADQARLAVPAVAAHHAKFFGDARGGSRDWLPRVDAPDIVGVVQALTRAGALFLTDALPESFNDTTRSVTLGLADHLPALCAAICIGPTTFVHGDYRVDNLFFGTEPGDPPLTVVDWQICYEACAPYDVAYFMTQSVAPEVRRNLEDELLRAYHAKLVENGVKGYDLDTCREDYRKAATYCLCYPLIAAGTLDLSNERGRALGKMMLARSLSAVEDADSAGILASLSS